MGLVCPNCGNAGSLQIESSMEIPPDSRSDEITVQLLACSNCEFQGVGVYEESRRGGFDDESVDHYGYDLDIDEWKRLAKIIRACPKPRDKKCACTGHKKLNVRNQYGRWSGLDAFELGAHFNVRYRK